MWERFGLSVMHRLDPERAHRLAINALKTGLVRGEGPVTSPRLRTKLDGMSLPNPVGLAAGFDKNAQVIAALTNAGFGFLEIGAVTPRGQAGNAKPRLFRLTEDAAAINRFGFNNEGMDRIATRLEGRARQIPVGLNLGANKDSDDRAQDFATVLRRLGPHVDFATVNVSSPNTERLRELQGRAALDRVLGEVMSARAELTDPIPVFLKIAPDLDDAALGEIAEAARSHALAGLVATNTTLSRAGLRSPHRAEAGGLSGQPLFERSTRVLAKLYRLTEGAVPLIGVGGVGTVEQAWQKISAGATAVQLYTALVYDGLSLAARIARGLDERLKAEGLSAVRDIVGTDADRWC